MNLPKPSKASYPRTFAKLQYHEPDDWRAWFTVVYGLITFAEQQMSDDHLPWPAISAEQVDCLCLAPDEWNKNVPNPESVQEMFHGIFMVGLGRLKIRGTSVERNRFADAIEECAKETPHLMFFGVGGALITKIYGGKG